jgi:hypothetical protein
MRSGNSPRINFRVDKEVNQILQETKDKSKFIREAIVYYWEYLENRDNDSVKIDVQEEKEVKIKKPESDIKQTKFIPIEEPIDADKPEKASNGTWNPPWLSR